jgi:hypothetical protein
MAPTKKRGKGPERDAISKLADAGEDALRQLVDFPRRAVVEVLDGVGDRLHDAATRLRSFDPLAGRVAELEQRLESIEKAKKTTPRKASRRPKPSTSPTTSVAVPPYPVAPSDPDTQRLEEERPTIESSGTEQSASE